MNYKERHEEVITSGKYKGRNSKIIALSQLNYNNDKSEGKENAVVMALDDYECMTGFYFDPTEEQFEDIMFSIF